MRFRFSSTSDLTIHRVDRACARSAEGFVSWLSSVSVRPRAFWRAFRGAPVIALVLTAAAWISLAVAYRTGDARFTGAFLLLAATAMILSFFSLYVERRWSAYVAFLVTLVAPIATVAYISRQSSGWLS